MLLWVVIILTLYFIRDIVRIGVSDILFTGIFGLAFFILPLEDSLAVFMLSCVLTLPGNEIRLLYVLCYFIKRKKRLVFPAIETICLLSLLVLQALDAFAYSTSGISSIAYDYITYILYLIIPFLWAGEEISKDKLIDAVKIYILGIVFIGMITVYMTIYLYGVSALFSGSNSLGRLLSGYSTGGMMTNNNRNALGTNMAIAMAYLLIMLDKRIIKRAIGLIGIISCAILIIMTRSRSAFVNLGIIVGFWTVITTTKRGRKGTSFAILAFLVLGILAIRQYLPDIWNGVVSRFIDQDDISNGRILINSQYINILRSDPKCLLFGYGALTYSNITNVINSPHNMFVDILISWGVIGCILLLVFLLSVANKSFKLINKQSYKYGFLLILVNLFGLMLDQYLTVPMKHIQFCFLLLTIRMLDFEKESFEPIEG